MNDIHNLGQSGCKTLEFNLYPRKCLIKINLYYAVEPVIAQISEYLSMAKLRKDNKVNKNNSSVIHKWKETPAFSLVTCFKDQLENNQ